MTALAFPVLQLYNQAELHQQALQLNSLLPTWLLEQKAAAWHSFISTGLPSRDQEEWKYCSLSALNKTPLRLAEKNSDNNPISEGTLAEAVRAHSLANAVTIPFIDGYLACPVADLKLPRGVTLGSFAELAPSEQAELGKLWRKRALAGPSSSMQALNCALFAEGFSLKVAKGVACEPLIHLLHFTSSIAPASEEAIARHPLTASFSQLWLRLEEGASAKICQSQVPLTAHMGVNSEKGLSLTQQTLTHVVSGLTFVQLAAGAELSYTYGQKQDRGCMQLQHTEVQQAKNSHWRSFSLAAGAKLARHSIEVWQEQEGAHAQLNGLFTGSAQQYCEERTAIHHGQAQGKSQQFYKGVVNGQARGVFLGKVCVARGAHKTQAVQLNKNLLLSPQAEIDTKPELEIDTDDVKCSHGATVAQLRAEELFYFQSRGIPLPQAKAMLSQAFLAEVLDLLPEAEVRELMASYLDLEALSSSIDSL